MSYLRTQLSMIVDANKTLNKTLNETCLEVRTLSRQRNFLAKEAKRSFETLRVERGIVSSTNTDIIDCFAYKDILFALSAMNLATIQSVILKESLLVLHTTTTSQML
jgi:hypothetical protein